MALFLFAAPRQSYYPHHRKKEGIVLFYYSAITFNKSDILPQVILLWFYVMFSHFLNTLLHFSREEKLSQRSWLDLRISANTAKWPLML